MIRFVLIIVLVAFSALIARGDSTDTDVLSSTDGRYQLTVPKGWELKDFHVEKAKIGAINKHLGEYAEVVAENLQDYSDSLQQYAQAKRDTMALSLDNPRLVPGEWITVNGVDAMRFELHGQLPNSSVSIGYVLTIFKTKTHYIQIIGWTKESQFAQRIADLDALAMGFSETTDSK